MSTGPPNSRLVSWKEIAAYLQCEVRTAQRWELERGLPVHRVPGDKRGSVYAYPEALDSWLSAVPTEELRNGPEPSAHPATPAWPWRARAALPVAGLLLAGLAVALTWQTTRGAPEIPSRFAFQGSSFVAYGADGRILWTHTLPGQFAATSDGATAERPHVIVHDLDGDGVEEVLAVTSYQASRGGGPVFRSEFTRFSATGKVLQHFTPGDTMTFGGRSYGPPWLLHRMLVTEEAGRNYLWLAFSHKQWWPSLLLKLDAEGNEAGRFVSAGWIMQLAQVRNSEGSFVLAGGISNEWDGAFLAVLRADAPSGTTPSSPGSEYSCENCPEGRPLRYFLFPRSELNLATASMYNRVSAITSSEEGTVYVHTSETPGVAGVEVASLYEFTTDFELRAAKRADSYWDLHRPLHREGKLDHSPEDCPERRDPPGVRLWRDGAWQELRPALPSSR